MGDRSWSAVAGPIPYPVIDGFMASAGWLVPIGGLGVATGSRVEASAVLRWLSGEGDVRLAAAGSGISEMDLFRNRPRSATLRVVEPTELRALRADRLATIEAEDPTLEAALYRLSVLQLTNRLDQLTVTAYLLKR